MIIMGIITSNNNNNNNNKVLNICKFHAVIKGIGNNFENIISGLFPIGELFNILINKCKCDDKRIWIMKIICYFQKYNGLTVKDNN